jgi:GT2 family glycosyltransferase
VDVSILLVSYNTRALTLECLASIEAETREVRHEVIVVDNASRDGSAAAIRAGFPRVQLIESATNTGFAGGVNLAARGARGRYLLLLNPDTRLLDGAIDRLVHFADACPNAGIYGGATFLPDGTPDHGSCWNRPTPWSLFCRATGLSALAPRHPRLDPEVVSLPADGSPREVAIVSGCFLLARRDLWDRLGGFDPVYFMYGEDFDLCLRARKLGARPRVDPGARLVHHGGASEHDDADRLVRLLRSKTLLYDRHWSAPWPLVGRGLLLLWALTRRIGYRIGALLGRGSAGENARAWDEVWRRSREFTATRSAPPDSTR